MAEYRPLFSQDLDLRGMRETSSPSGYRIVHEQIVLERQIYDPVADKVREIRKQSPSDALKVVCMPSVRDLPKYFHQEDVRRYGKTL